MQSKKLLSALIELEESENTPIRCDLSHRGGSYTIPAEAALYLLGFSGDLDIKENLLNHLPDKIGAGCNYLGGGLRGAVFSTGGRKVFIQHGLPENWAIKFEQLGEVLKTRYIQLEGALNNEIDEDGEIDWNAKGTQAARRSGVVSAY